MPVQTATMKDAHRTQAISDFRWAIGVALVCVLAAVFAPTRSDPDLWGHTRFGLDVLASHTLPAVDTYSFTQDRPQLYHEWLGAVLIALAYAAGASFGVVLLKIVICVVAFWIVKDRLLQLAPIDACLLAILIAWNEVPLTLYVRPQLWTMVGVLLLVRLLQDGRYWWIPPLFAAWANLHGGWVMGIGVLGTWCAATVVETWWRTRQIEWRLLVLPAAAAAATLLTPYGWHLWQFLAETVGLSRSDIMDWQPLFATWDIAQVPIAITVGLLVAVSINRKTRPSWAWILVCLLLIYSSVRVSRVAFLSMPAILLIILPSLVMWLPAKKSPAGAPSRTAALFALVPATLALVVTAMTIAPAFTCMPIKGEWIPDPAAVAVLKQGVDGGRVVTFFDWGEYALWHLGPRLKVSMDGRRETLYSPRMLAVHHAIYDNSEEGHTWLTQQRPEYVWLKSMHAKRKDWLTQHGYRIDWQSKLSWVAVRNDLPHLSGPTTMTSSGCFPGP